jgi:hypothetical protein
LQGRGPIHAAYVKGADKRNRRKAYNGDGHFNAEKRGFCIFIRQASTHLPHAMHSPEVILSFAAMSMAHRAF